MAILWCQPKTCNIIMKPHLLDIVKHTHALGIDLVKISSNENETTINAVADGQSVVIEGRFNTPISELNGTFGMPNLSKLSTILNIPEYKDDAKISVNFQTRNNEEMAVGIHFENKMGDFKNDYRLMATEVINDKMKPLKLKGVNWNVTFVPTVNSVQRFKFQSNANAEETTFVASSEENDALVFYFGNAGTHAGNFVFATATGTVNKRWKWPIAQVLSILSLPGDKEYKISNDGVSMITVNSGMCEYKYIIPALK